MDCFRKCLRLMDKKKDVEKFLMVGTMEQNYNLLQYMEKDKDRYKDLYNLLQKEIYRKTALNYANSVVKTLQKGYLTQEKTLMALENTKKTYCYLTCKDN